MEDNQLPINVNLTDSDHDLLIKLHAKADQQLIISKDHEARLRKIEQDSWKVKGALAVIGFVSVLIEPLVTWTKHK